MLILITNIVLQVYNLYFNKITTEIDENGKNKKQTNITQKIKKKPY